MAADVRTSVGLDLGATKVAVAVVTQQTGDRPAMEAYAEKSCRFLRRGVIVNLEKMVSAVQYCLEEIKTFNKMPIRRVVVNLPAARFLSEKGENVITLKRKREIKSKHVLQLVQGTRLNTSDEWMLVHSIPEEYVVDNQRGIRSPIGMSGRSLGFRVHQVYAPVRNVHDVVHALSKCKLKVSNLVIDPIGVIESITTPDERELGVWVVDFGGEFISMAAIKENRIHLFQPLKLGGDLITNDISITIRTPIPDAEILKIKHGVALAELLDSNKEIEVPSLGSDKKRKKITRNLLAEIIYSRVDEIFELVAKTFTQQLEKTQYPAGVILTGRSILISGVKELAEKHFQMPVNLGQLRRIEMIAHIDAPGKRGKHSSAEKKDTEVNQEFYTAQAVGLAVYGLKNVPFQPWIVPGKNPLRRLFKYNFIREG